MTTHHETDDLTAALDVVRPLLPMDESLRAAMRSPNALTDAALWYARRGWRVFPLKVGGKEPLTRRGFKDASSDLATVTAWWRTTPQANIGTPTGERFDVVDIDAPEGFDTWARFLDHRHELGRGEFPTVGTAETGSGGRHLLVPLSGVRNGTSLGKGVDVRGLGGYVVLPPSRLTNGGEYSWVTLPTV